MTAEGRALITLLLGGCASMLWLALVLERRLPWQANGIDGPEVRAEPVLDRPHPAVDKV